MIETLGKVISEDSKFASLRSIRLWTPDVVISDEINDDEEFEWGLVERVFLDIPLVEHFDSELNRYLGYAQNDAFVIGLSHQDDSLRFTFGHYDFFRLAAVFAPFKMKELDKRAKEFPIEIIFDGVTECHCIKLFGTKEIFARPEPIETVSKSAMEISELRCIMCTKSSSSFILRLNTHDKKPLPIESAESFGPYFLEMEICVTASKARVNDMVREKWVRRFGYEFDRIYDEFEKIWPVQSWGMVDFENYVKEFN